MNHTPIAMQAPASGLDAPLVADLLAFMGQADASEDAFNTLALRLFAHQFAHNLPFAKFARQRGRTPRTVNCWQDIPAVPISAFKEFTLSCVPPAACERIFMTSGTTRADVRGRNHHPTLAVYDCSMTLNFQRRFMNMNAAGLPALQKLRMGILFPDEVQMPNSSLAHYLALAMQQFGAVGSRYLMNAQGLQTEALCEMLIQAQETGEPLALLGASYSFVHALDALQARGLTCRLPAGSRLLDTGGFKGQSREMDLSEFYARLTHCLGVPASACINMYGMTELSTQFYDAGNASLPSVKSGPPWIRSRVIDPLSGQDMPAGERGILVHCDLGNFNSVTTLMTEDVGVAVDDGFQLLGRAQGAAAKGCSLAVDAFLQAARA